jgi:D-alanyl-D-alanine carboxypeptidase
MKKNIYAFVLIFCAVLSLNSTTAFSQGFSPQVQARLQRVLDSFQSNPANPVVGGMSAAIKVDGLAFWQGAAGYRSRKIDAENNLLPGGSRFTTATLSRMYSITKTFTAPLVLLLAQEGFFSLDDPIKKYMPQIDLYNKNGINTDVTIRQLLNHTSGYSDWEEEQNLQIAIAYSPKHKWTPYEMVAYTHQLSAPGTVSRYSHNNYVFLGAIIETATGKPAHELLRSRFFDPLHLNSIYFSRSEPKGDRGVLAAPHDNISPFNPIFQLTGQPTYPDAYTNILRFPMDGVISLAFTGGALVSNVADIAEWGNALFSGRATGKAVLKQMMESISPVPDEFGNKLGFGIKKYDTRISDHAVFYGHNGSAPGYRSVMVYNPERRLTIAFLSNFGGIDPYAVAKALFEAVPEFLGNNGSDEIKLCWYNNSICVPRYVAPFFIKYGAFLGNCNEQNGQQTNTATQNLLVRKNRTEPAEVTGLMVYPNPMRSAATVRFSAVQTGKTSVRLYDMNGKLVRMLFEGSLQKGAVQQVPLDASGLPAGMYITELQTMQGRSRQKVVVSH